MIHSHHHLMLHGFCSWWSNVIWTKKQALFLYVIIHCCLKPVPQLTHQWDPFVDFITYIRFWNSTKTGKEFQHFTACQGFVDAIKLWAVADLCQELEKIYYLVNESRWSIIIHLTKKNYSCFLLQAFKIFDAVCEVSYSHVSFDFVCNTERGFCITWVFYVTGTSLYHFHIKITYSSCLVTSFRIDFYFTPSYFITLYVPFTTSLKHKKFRVPLNNVIITIKYLSLIILSQ